MKRILAPFLVLFFITLTAHAQTIVPADVDAYVAKVMRELNVPGAPVAIVKDDRVVYAKAFGVKELGKPAPVTTDTKFAIGSISKSFTATLLGILVDEKKIDWDDHVSKYLPAYAMWDPWVTREQTVRDLSFIAPASGRSAAERSGTAPTIRARRSSAARVSSSR